MLVLAFRPTGCRWVIWLVWQHFKVFFSFLKMLITKFRAYLVTLRGSQHWQLVANSVHASHLDCVLALSAVTAVWEHWFWHLIFLIEMCSHSIVPCSQVLRKPLDSCLDGPFALVPLQWSPRGTACSRWRSTASSRTSTGTGLSSEPASARPRSSKWEEPSTCEAPTTGTPEGRRETEREPPRQRPTRSRCIEAIYWSVCVCINIYIYIIQFLVRFTLNWIWTSFTNWCHFIWKANFTTALCLLVTGRSNHPVIVV